MGDTTAIQEISQFADQVQVLVAGRPLTITTEAELTVATGWLATVRKRRKEVEEFFNRLVKPFREAIGKHNAERDNMLASLRKGEAELDAEIRDYRAQEARKAAAAQAKLDAQHERRVERAIEQGKDPALVKPPPVMAAPAKTVQTDGGSVSFRKVRKFKVLDPQQVPDEYWVIDETKIGKAVRAGINVPGCHIWEEEVSAVS